METPPQSSPYSSSSSSTSSGAASPETQIGWKSEYKLGFGANPEKITKNEWRCSLNCRKEGKDGIPMFKDRQAVEKHILRKHPDQNFNEFVCLKCPKRMVSPQQILDHLGQSVEKGGHSIKKTGQRGKKIKMEKDNNMRAVHMFTGKQYR